MFKLSAPLSSALAGTTRLPVITISGLALLSVGWVVGLSGCNSSSTDQKQATVSREDPEAEFNWGMERLERALRNFRPSGAGGLNVLNRQVDYKLIPPDKQTAHFRAQVTVTTETAFLHSKRRREQEEPQAEADKQSEIKDPLANPEDELSKLVDIPGAGSQAAAAPPARVESRTQKDKSVFHLAYLQGHWQLTEKPEKKHEQLWFDYAF